MLPGPNYIYQCPKCGNLLSNGSLSSGNTIGAQVFSDGKRIAPMLPEYTDLTKCKSCNTIFWLSKLKEIGTQEWGDNENSKWQEANTAEFLELDDYFEALNNHLAETNDDELFIRERIWWSYNDRLRRGENIFMDEKDEMRWKENVKNLLKLLDESKTNRRIMIAEINRNLGDFKKCIMLIESIDNEELNWLKEKFVNECKRKNRWVVALT